MSYFFTCWRHAIPQVHGDPAAAARDDAHVREFYERPPSVKHVQRSSAIQHRVTAFIALVCATLPLDQTRSEPLQVSLAGSAQVVFDYSRDHCERADIPDTPARAFRDAQGQVHLFSTQFVNRAMTGPDLNSVRRDCRVVFRGNTDDRPEAFNDRGWLASFYTRDGRTVSALVHNEFHGEVRPGACAAKRAQACWYNTITYAKSADGGQSFSAVPAPGNLIAAIPERYDGARGRRAGAFSPSNILEWNGFFYTLFVFEDTDTRGICVMRTRNIAEPSQWRAWGGKDFNVRLIDPFRNNVMDRAAHRCKPVSNLFPNTIGGVVRHEPSGTFIAVQTIAGRRDAPAGVYYSLSKDLVNWSEPAALMPAPVFDSFDCSRDKVSFGYGSILDPKSKSRVFETVGETAFLYLTRFTLERCKRSVHRDLVRVPIMIGPK